MGGILGVIGSVILFGIIWVILLIGIVMHERHDRLRGKDSIQRNEENVNDIESKQGENEINRNLQALSPPVQILCLEILNKRVKTNKLSNYLCVNSLCFTSYVIAWCHYYLLLIIIVVLWVD